MNIVYKKLTELHEYGHNPRDNEPAVESVANSIREFGFKVPIVVDKNGVIAAGHTRYKASKRLGLEEVPCIVADDLTDAQIKAFRLADNKVGELATWDENLLNMELNDLKDWDMSRFGFENLNALGIGSGEIAEVEEDNFEIPEDMQPRTKRGDIWQLGSHRLMCGDSTSKADVDALIDGNIIDLVFTDPPYGMKKQKDGVANDNLNFADLLEFNKKWATISFEILKDNGSWYCWGIDEPLMDIYSNILKPLITQNKITFRNLITWYKGDCRGEKWDGARSYMPADEKCLFVMAGVQGFNTNSDNYFDGWDKARLYLVSEAEKVGLTAAKLKEICGVGMYSHWFTKSQFGLIPREHYEKLQAYYSNDAFKKDYDAVKKDYYDTRAYFDNTHDKMNSVWQFPVTSQAEREDTGGHATPKPLKLCERAIKTSSREGENVLDLFGGSGSTLIACEQLGRNAYLMELEEKWCDVIIARWEKVTGLEAVKI